MDVKLEDIQFLEIFDIFRETFKIIYTWRKIFTQIALSLILPLTFIFLAHMEISNLLFGNFIHYQTFLDRNQNQEILKYEDLSDLISPKWTFFWLFNIAYIICLFSFSLLATSAVVYAVACTHTGREVSFKQIMIVVPTVWKRLLVTFFCVIASFFVYNLLAAFTVLLIIWILIIRYGPFGEVNGSIFVVFFVFYFVGSLYLSIILQLSSVVSVLEESYGFKAMVKSKSLLKGKMVAATIILLVVSLSLVIIQQAFQRLVLHGGSIGMMGRGIFGIICLFLLMNFFLWNLVLETMLYFVCKSQQQEDIDKSVLSSRLEVYLLNRDYLPLINKHIELEKMQV